MRSVHQWTGNTRTNIDDIFPWKQQQWHQSQLFDRSTWKCPIRRQNTRHPSHRSATDPTSSSAPPAPGLRPPLLAFNFSRSIQQHVSRIYLSQHCNCRLRNAYTNYLAVHLAINPIRAHDQKSPIHFSAKFKRRAFIEARNGPTVGLPNAHFWFINR